jgi:hypothetical protein
VCHLALDVCFVHVIRLQSTLVKKFNGPTPRNIQGFPPVARASRPPYQKVLQAG